MRNVRLANVATLGPDGRDIYDSFGLTNTQTDYAALWDTKPRYTGTHSATKSILGSIDIGSFTKASSRSKLVWNTTGTLMLPKESWLSTNHVAAVVLQKPHFLTGGG